MTKHIDPRTKEEVGAKQIAIGLEEMACTLDVSEDYRVLRRLGIWPMKYDPEEETREGLYVDVEATGLDTERDEVIELAAYPFKFTLDGRIVDLGDPLHFYSEPRKKITAEITKLTGITEEMVVGQSIDVPELERWVDRIDLVVAHHAEYDRPMLERITKKFERKCWGCSMSQVPWAEYGIGGRKLEYILAALGRFYRAHNATTDCFAGLFALQSALGLPENPTELEQALAGGAEFKTALAHVLEATRATTFHVWALKAPFESKDALKARGYQWNGGEDGRPKAWHKEIGESDLEAEKVWLSTNVYRILGMPPFRADRVTAFDRFTKRG